MTSSTRHFDKARSMFGIAPAPVDETPPSGRRRAAAAALVRERRSILLMVPVVMLLIIGLGAMLSASSVVSIRETGDPLFYIKRQVVWVGLGLAAFVLTTRIPYRYYERMAVPIYLFGVAGLVATLLVGDVRGGARRWIELGPITLQPSEFAKLATVVMLAAILARKGQLLRRLGHFTVPVLATVGTVALLLLLQPDFGTAMIIGGAAFAVLVASAAPFGYLAGIAALGGTLAVLAAVTSGYRKDRIIGFLDPFADPLNTGHQAVQSLVALGTGGWFGVGLGASRARWSFLPNAHTDFIFAIIGEETGFVGAMLVIALFALFGYIGVRVVLNAPDSFSRMLAVGIVGWLSLQALVNVGGVVGVLPITGVPLPFVSSGGNAMLINLAAVGILVNIARSSPVPGRRR
jgi:cell division protein FtsW